MKTHLWSIWKFWERSAARETVGEGREAGLTAVK